MTRLALTCMNLARKSWQRNVLRTGQGPRQVAGRPPDGQKWGLPPLPHPQGCRQAMDSTYGLSATDPYLRTYVSNHANLLPPDFQGGALVISNLLFPNQSVGANP